jgi:hypothetical protein
MSDDLCLRLSRGVSRLERTCVICPSLNTELFFCPRRSVAYIDLLAEMKKSIFRICMGFLPYLYPNYFQANTTKGCMHFLRALREGNHVGFISSPTRDDYRNRIVRRPGAEGPVFVLGGDGIELERQKVRVEENILFADWHHRAAQAGC